ncbi:hypothetical protein [Lutibacter sp.]
MYQFIFSVLQHFYYGEEQERSSLNWHATVVVTCVFLFPIIGAVISVLLFFEKNIVPLQNYSILFRKIVMIPFVLLLFGLVSLYISRKKKKRMEHKVLYNSFAGPYKVKMFFMIGLFLSSIIWLPICLIEIIDLLYE